MAKILSSRLPDPASLEAHLAGLGMFHMRLGSARMHEACKRLGLDRPGPALVQVVGTNGKGSTAHFLSRIALAHGLPTGLYTSPHFLNFHERIRINGLPATPGQALDWANHVLEHAGDLELTYFELMTLMAVYGFARLGMALAVLEAGLGGRNDATSAFTPEVVLFTPFGLDHEHIIGPDLKDIALDKAGAIKARGTAVTGPQDPPVMEILRREAESSSARLLTADAVLAGFFEPDPASPGLAGPHQKDNARLALAGWITLCNKTRWTPDRASCRAALASSSWPGRLQRIAGTPGVILDGAHNAPALLALEKALESLGLRPRALVFACMRDKNLEAMAKVVRRLTSGPIFVPELPMYERARPARETAEVLGRAARAVDGVAAAMELAGRAGDPVLVCGSLYLLAEVYRLHPQWLN